MTCQTRKRPSATIAPAIASIKATATDNQTIVNESVDAVITAFLKDDAAIVADILTAANPIDRLARIISQAARSVPAGSGTPELIRSLDDLRFALNPALKPMSEDESEKVWGVLRDSPVEWAWETA